MSHCPESGPFLGTGASAGGGTGARTGDVFGASAGGVAAAATDIARILFFVFLVLFVVALLLGRGRPPAT